MSVTINVPARIINEREYWYHKTDRRNKELSHLFLNQYSSDYSEAKQSSVQLWKQIKPHPKHPRPSYCLENFWAMLADGAVKFHKPSHQQAFAAWVDNDEVLREAVFDLFFGEGDFYPDLSDEESADRHQFPLKPTRHHPFDAVMFNQQRNQKNEAGKKALRDAMVDHPEFAAAVVRGCPQLMGKLDLAGLKAFVESNFAVAATVCDELNYAQRLQMDFNYLDALNLLGRRNMDGKYFLQALRYVESYAPRIFDNIIENLLKGKDWLSLAPLYQNLEARLFGVAPNEAVLEFFLERPTLFERFCIETKTDYAEKFVKLAKDQVKFLKRLVKAGDNLEGLIFIQNHILEILPAMTENISRSRKKKLNKLLRKKFNTGDDYVSIQGLFEAAVEDLLARYDSPKLPIKFFYSKQLKKLMSPYLRGKLNLRLDKLRQLIGSVPHDKQLELIVVQDRSLWSKVLQEPEWYDKLKVADTGFVSNYPYFAARYRFQKMVRRGLFDYVFKHQSQEQGPVGVEVSAREAYLLVSDKRFWHQLHPHKRLNWLKRQAHNLKLYRKKVRLAQQQLSAKSWVFAAKLAHRKQGKGQSFETFIVEYADKHDLLSIPDAAALIADIASEAQLVTVSRQNQLRFEALQAIGRSAENALRQDIDQEAQVPTTTETTPLIGEAEVSEALPDQVRLNIPRRSYQENPLFQQIDEDPFRSERYLNGCLRDWSDKDAQLQSDALQMSITPENMSRFLQGTPEQKAYIVAAVRAFPAVLANLLDRIDDDVYQQWFAAEQKWLIDGYIELMQYREVRDGLSGRQLIDLFDLGASQRLLGRDIKVVFEQYPELLSRMLTATERMREFLGSKFIRFTGLCDAPSVLVALAVDDMLRLANIDVFVYKTVLAKDVAAFAEKATLAEDNNLFYTTLAIDYDLGIELLFQAKGNDLADLLDDPKLAVFLLEQERARDKVSQQQLLQLFTIVDEKVSDYGETFYQHVRGVFTKYPRLLHRLLTDTSLHSDLVSDQYAHPLRRVLQGELKPIVAKMNFPVPVIHWIAGWDATFANTIMTSWASTHRDHGPTLYHLINEVLLTSSETQIERLIPALRFYLLDIDEFTYDHLMRETPLLIKLLSYQSPVIKALIQNVCASSPDFNAVVLAHFVEETEAKDLAAEYMRSIPDFELKLVQSTVKNFEFVRRLGRNKRAIRHCFELPSLELKKMMLGSSLYADQLKMAGVKFDRDQYLMILELIANGADFYFESPGFNNERICLAVIIPSLFEAELWPQYQSVLVKLYHSRYGKQFLENCLEALQLKQLYLNDVENIGGEIFHFFDLQHERPVLHESFICDHVDCLVAKHLDEVATDADMLRQIYARHQGDVDFWLNFLSNQHVADSKTFGATFLQVFDDQDHAGFVAMLRDPKHRYEWMRVPEVARYVLQNPSLREECGVDYEDIYLLALANNSDVWCQAVFASSDESISAFVNAAVAIAPNDWRLLMTDKVDLNSITSNVEFGVKGTLSGWRDQRIANRYTREEFDREASQDRVHALAALLYPHLSQELTSDDYTKLLVIAELGRDKYEIAQYLQDNFNTLWRHRANLQMWCNDVIRERAVSPGLATAPQRFLSQPSRGRQQRPTTVYSEFESQQWKL